jgi:rRNA-processing protein FCF1
MYSEENKPSKLAATLSVYDYVFVDTCSLMEDGFAPFADTLSAAKDYLKEGLRIIVLPQCVDELKKHAKNTENQERRIEAKRAMKILRHDQRWLGPKVFEIGKSKENSTYLADNAIYSEVASLRIANKVLIITQDKTLAHDLLAMNHLDSQRGRWIGVMRLDDEGNLYDNNGEPNFRKRDQGHKPPAGNRNTQDQQHNHARERGQDQARRPSLSDSERAGPVRASRENGKYDEIIAKDKRLCSNLNNPNYPNEKRLQDIDAQLALLQALSPEEKEKLYLAYNEQQLEQERAKIAPPGPEAKKPTRLILNGPGVDLKAMTKDSEPKPEAKRPEQKPEPKPEPKPISAPVIDRYAKDYYPAKKPWFETGSSIEEAVIACGSHYGFIFRDASVPYYKEVHGPYDITIDDIRKASEGVNLEKAGDHVNVPLKGLSFIAEKEDRGYKVYLILPEKNVSDPSTRVAKAAKKAAEEPKEAPLKKEEKAPKKAEPAKVEPAPKKAKAPAKKAPTKVVVTENGHAVVPEGVVLASGEVKEHRPAKKAASKPAEQKKPAKKPAPKKEPAKKAAPKAAPKEAKPAAKIEDVQAAEQRLNAVLPNPKYATENKIKDVKAQIEMMKGLDAKSRKTLKYTQAKLKEILKELEAK